jgi:hypothetical protein
MAMSRHRRLSRNVVLRCVRDVEGVGRGASSSDDRVKVATLGIAEVQALIRLARKNAIIPDGG